MKEKAIKAGPLLVLRLLLVGILVVMWAGVGVVSAATPNPVRSLPQAVAPGQEFEVIVTFTAPEDGFTVISLSDRAPDGWTVSVDTGWCTPNADLADTPQPNRADYLWGMFDTYDKDTAFTAVYRVQVPVGTEPGEYTFELEGFQYFMQVDDELTGPSYADMGGNDKVEAISGDDEIVPGPYELTIDSTEGGTVTTLGEGSFTYDPGTVVDLVAEAREGYRFVNWTGDVDTIDDVNAVTTTIAMDGNHSLTANFEKISRPPINRALTGGVVGAVAVVALVILYRRRRRTF